MEVVVRGLIFLRVSVRNEGLNVGCLVVRDL